MSLPYIFLQVPIVNDFSSFLSTADQFNLFQFQVPSCLQMWPTKYGMLEDRNTEEQKGKKEIQRWLQTAKCLSGNLSAQLSKF